MGKKKSGAEKANHNYRHVKMDEKCFSGMKSLKSFGS